MQHFLAGIEAFLARGIRAGDQGAQGRAARAGFHELGSVHGHAVLPVGTGAFLARDLRRLGVLIGVNYFFGSATTISPYQRQLPFDLAGAEGEARPRACVFLLEIEKPWRWESGKPVFGFPFFHPTSPSGLWECGNLACCWRDFQRGSWKEGEACFWLSTLSTAP